MSFKINSSSGHCKDKKICLSILSKWTAEFNANIQYRPRAALTLMRQRHQNPHLGAVMHPNHSASQLIGPSNFQNICKFILGYKVPYAKYTFDWLVLARVDKPSSPFRHWSTPDCSSPGCREKWYFIRLNIVLLSDVQQDRTYWKEKLPGSFRNVA